MEIKECLNILLTSLILNVYAQEGQGVISTLRYVLTDTAGVLEK